MYYGEPGLNLERWLFWKERFREIADDDEGEFGALEEETRRIAGEAKEFMDEVEWNFNGRVAEYWTYLEGRGAGVEGYGDGS